MACVRSIAALLTLGIATIAQAQHFHHGHHGMGFWNAPYATNSPYTTSSGGGWSGNDHSSTGPMPDRTGYSGFHGGGGIRGHYPYRPTGYHVMQTPVMQTPVYQSPVFQTPVYVAPGPILLGPVAPIVPPMVFPVVSVTPVAQPKWPAAIDDPVKLPPKASTTAGKLKSLEHQANGDEQFRKRLWAQAYMRYRSAIDAAGDRGEARFRQAFTYTAMQHYDSAVREFKRGLFLDRDLPLNGIKLPVLFGPGSDAVRTSILYKVSDWVKDDPKDPDRLFLLGLLLHYEDDPRSNDVLRAAQQLSEGSSDHISVLLAAQKQQPLAGKPGLLAELPPLPEMAPIDAAIPLPPAPVLPALKQVAEPIPTGLPRLLDRPIPPFVATRD